MREPTPDNFRAACAKWGVLNAARLYKTAKWPLERTLKILRAAKIHEVFHVEHERWVPKPPAPNTAAWRAARDARFHQQAREYPCKSTRP